ncbi:MAG: FAD-binding domain-containing protein, partial [Bacteroidota bacterium]
RSQAPILHHSMPRSISMASTGVLAVDEAIKELYKTGYMHNHMRMYVAAICTNMAFAHWKIPARWMYYHLLDADWASNALSWQWVAGSNANKKYVANQENINKYWKSIQKDTFLDVSYSAFENWEVPPELMLLDDTPLKCELPEKSALHLDYGEKVLIYNFYNLDPNWHEDENANRILLLEPSFFERYPVSSKTIEFMLDLSSNIKEVQVFVGEFDELEIEGLEVIFKEHPTNLHYRGQQEERDWMFSVKGYFPSFFSFWKKCKKELTW